LPTGWQRISSAAPDRQSAEILSIRFEIDRAGAPRLVGGEALRALNPPSPRETINQREPVSENESPRPRHAPLVLLFPRNPMVRSLSFVLFLALISSGVPGIPAEESPPAKPGTPEQAGPAQPSREELEKAFAEKLSGVVFTGSYSVTSGGEEKPARMEKYTITKVSKWKDDYWIFNARIQYGKNDVTLPMTLPVKWAGDTPVITLTNLTIPGLGTFTSRVLIHGDRYAGTWQHDQTGGHLWGRIEKIDPNAPATPAKPAASAERK
jgi:hypothetical protein